MKCRLRSVALFALSSLLTFTAVPVRAGDIFEVIPEDALGFVVLHNPAAVSKKSARLAQKVSPFTPDPLTMLKITFNLSAGLDDKGVAAVVAMPPENDESTPMPLALIPVTDYAKFIAQLNPEKAEDGVSKATFQNKPIVVGEKKGYALITAEPYGEVLAELLKADDNLVEDVKPIRAFLAEQDVAWVITSEGISTGVELMLDSLDEAEGQMDAAMQDAEFDMSAMLLEYFDLLRDAGEAIEEEVTHVAVGTRIGDDASISFNIFAAFDAEGEWAKEAAAQPASQNPLASIEAGTFVGAFGTGSFPAWMNTMSDMNMDMMKAMAEAADAKVSDKDFEEMQKTQTDMLNQVKGMSMVLGVSKPDKPIFSKMSVYALVEDSDAYLMLAEKSNELITRLYQGMDNPLFKSMTLEKTTIVGTKALVVSLDLGKIIEGQGIPADPAAMAVLDKVLGPGGKFTEYFAPLDKKTLVMALDKDRLVEMLGSRGAPITRLIDDSQVKKTAALLPKPSQTLGYLSIGGCIELANNFISAVPGMGGNKLPEFPKTPPIGWGSKTSVIGWEGRLVVPGELVEGVAQYIVTVQQKFAAPPGEAPEKPDNAL